jgi:hypothetical protein
MRLNPKDFSSEPKTIDFANLKTGFLPDVANYILISISSINKTFDRYE